MVVVFIPPERLARTSRCKAGQLDMRREIIILLGEHDRYLALFVVRGKE